jgi:hypothetical protein
MPVLMNTTRRPQVPGSLSRVVNVRWTDADYQQLHTLAAAEGVALSELIRLLTRWALLTEPDAEMPEDATTPEQLVGYLVAREHAAP